MNLDLNEIKNGNTFADSLTIAEVFGKEHAKVIIVIEKLIADIEEGNLKITYAKFSVRNYKGSDGKMYRNGKPMSDLDKTVSNHQAKSVAKSAANASKAVKKVQKINTPKAVTKVAPDKIKIARAAAEDKQTTFGNGLGGPVMKLFGFK